MMTNRRTVRKLVLYCALLLLGFAGTAEASAGCCPAAVSACDGACAPGGQWSCQLGMQWVGCYCNGGGFVWTDVPASICGG